MSRSSQQGYERHQAKRKIAEEARAAVQLIQSQQQEAAAAAEQNE